MAQNKEQIIQRMIDAGEDEDNIATVIRSFKDVSAPAAKPDFGNVKSGSSTNISPFAGSPKFSSDVISDEPQQEPDSYWGGFGKGLKDYGREVSSDIMPMLESGARPQTTGDFLNLVIPSELPHIARGALSGIAGRIAGKPIEKTIETIPEIAQVSQPGKLNRIGESITKAERPAGPWDSNFDSTDLANFADEPPNPFAYTPKSSSDKIYDMAREKFGMGADNPNLVEEVINPNPFSPEALAAGKKTNFDKDLTLQADETTNPFSKESLTKNKINPNEDIFDTSDIDPFQQRIENMRADTEHMKIENAKPLPIDQQNYHEDWNRSQRNSARYEGRNINDAVTPLTKEQQLISDSFKKIRAHSDEYGSNFQKMEDALPEGEFYKPPPETKARYEAEQSRLYDEHERLVNKLSPLEKSRPATLDAEFTVQPRNQKSIQGQADKPTAEFLGLNQDGTPLFNVVGGESHQSTVGLAKLKELGIEAPPVPKDAVPVRGEDLRRIALENKNKPDLMNEFQSQNKGPVPAGKPYLDENGEVIGHTTDNAGSTGFRSLADKQQSRSAAMDLKNKGFRETSDDFGSNVNEEIGFATASNQPSDLPGLDPRTQQIITRNNQAAKLANEGQKKNLWRETRDANRAVLTSYDFSAPGRQGKALMATKAYWTSFDDMFKSWGSQRAYDTVVESIHSHPNFKGTTSSLTGKPQKSLAERAGLDITGKEEFLNSNIAEKLIPGVKRSERAYNAFLSKLRADHFNTLVSDYEKSGINIGLDDTKLQALGKFINDATGRGDLGRFEKASSILNDVFFAPKLMASRVNMYKKWLNPMSYSSADPIMRKQIVKSLLSTVGFGLAVGELARLGGATVSNDPISSDFRKAKIGNSRIDPFSGFQQYATAATRMLSGEMANSKNPNRPYDLTSGKFGAPSRATVASQFFENKLAPIPSFVWSWMEGKDFAGKPFEWKKAMLDKTVPIVMQDLADIYKEDPKSLPPGIFRDNPTATKIGMAALPMIGEGLQTYGR